MDYAHGAYLPTYLKYIKFHPVVNKKLKHIGMDETLGKLH
jgi:hypothetical protein